MSISVENLTNCILGQAKDKQRFFVAIAGPPAAGKTTICSELENRLALETSVAVVAMDGFHYDNRILNDLNRFHRKGAPDTFDVTGLQLLLQGLTQQTNPVAAPVFDRQQDLSRSSARMIHPEDHIILVEGNYLLCDTAPWKELHVLFDLTVLMKEPISLLEERLVQRWLDHDHTQEQAKQRAHSNDLPNAEYVLKHSVRADYELSS